MVFYSILFQGPEDDIRENSVTEPDFFSDLHIDQIVHAIISGYEEYNLKPYFYAPLPGIREISYQHEIVRDLENEQIHTAVSRFAQGMQMMRSHLVQSEKLHYPWQKKSWFFDAARIYCDTVRGLVHELNACTLNSQGFFDLQEYLRHYIASEPFTHLCDEINQLTAEFATVSYCVIIRGKEITVRRYEPGDDFSDTVVSTFARFLDEPSRYFHENFPEYPEMNHIEGQIL
ncbi:hypothetical protein, partial [Methanospirillum hungatei]|uniref:hypothetical protein n=1 Tax=Methanospirillum hungatei TaxID=2203 RepID=UPI0026E9C93F